MKASEKIELWRQRYFEAQAAAEEFVLGKHGQEGLNQWMSANAEITARLLEAQKPEGQSKTKHFMTRLLKQLKLYDSKISLKEIEGDFKLVNTECGILRYRKAAAEKGVKLTFKSPCDYCEGLNTAIAEKYTAQRNVTCQRTEKGCLWSAKNG